MAQASRTKVTLDHFGTRFKSVPGSASSWGTYKSYKESAKKLVANW